MRISKSAPDLLKKAVRSVKNKTDALKAKLIILASLRRRLAMVCAISRQIHGPITSESREKQARVEHHSKALMVRKAMERRKEPAGDDQGVRAQPGLFEVAMFEEEDYHGYPDCWTNSLFDDDHCYKNQEDVDDDDDDDLDILDTLDDEPSVIEIIRSKREVEGLEFNMDDDIDEACDMFIRRFRSRMNRSLSDVCISKYY